MKGGGGRSGTIRSVELEVTYIVVALVVLAAEDAASVIRGAQVIGNLRVLGKAVFRQRVEHIEVLVLADIDLQRGERALLLRRAIETAVGSALGFVLACKERKRAEGRHAFAGFAEQPADDIQVVASLGYDDGCSLLGGVPVTTNV